MSISSHFSCTRPFQILWNIFSLPTSAIQCSRTDCKKWEIFGVGAVKKCANRVDLKRCCKMSILFQNRLLYRRERDLRSLVQESHLLPFFAWIPLLTAEAVLEPMNSRELLAECHAHLLPCIKSRDSFAFSMRLLKRDLTSCIQCNVVHRRFAHVWRFPRGVELRGMYSSVRAPRARFSMRWTSRGHALPMWSGFSLQRY